MSKPNATPTEFDPKGIKTVKHVRETSFADIVSVAPTTWPGPRPLHFLIGKKAP